MSIEKQLRDTLRRVADDFDPTDAASGVRSEGMRVLAHRRRRQRMSVASAGLAAVLVAVAVPLGVSLLSAEPKPPDAPVAASSPPQTTADASAFDGPTRGSLAGNADFVEAIRQLDWLFPEEDDLLAPNPPVETRRVVYVGEFVQDDEFVGTAALVVGSANAEPTPAPSGEPDTYPRPPEPPSEPASEPTAESPTRPGYPQTDQLAAVWFIGPAGASADQMHPNQPRWISPDLPTSLFDDTTGTLLVIAAPGDTVEVSPRPEVAADGTVSRAYAASERTDGIAIAAVLPVPYDGPPSAQFRISRAGSVVAELAPDERIYGAPDGPDLELHYLRTPDYGGQDGLGSEELRIAASILSEYGLAADQVRFDVHYVGPLPGSRASTYAGLQVLTATFPSGAVLTRAEWIEMSPVLEPNKGDGYSYGLCADELSPAGLPAALRFIAIRCVVGAESEDDQSSLIVIPPGDGDAFYAEVGATERLVLYFDESGIGILDSFPDGAQTVLVYSVDEALLAEVSIWTE